MKWRRKDSKDGAEDTTYYSEYGTQNTADDSENSSDDSKGQGEKQNAKEDS